METTTDIRSYIKRALGIDNSRDCHITLTNSTENTDGYVSDFSFASILVTTEGGSEEKFEIAVKKNRMKPIGPNTVFQREIYFYAKILPEFIRFQKRNNIENIFNSVPRYYNSISDNETYVIVLENLKKSGYKLYDRKKPLDLNHIQLVLGEYGKLHAISFALRNQNRSDFEKLVNSYEDLFLPALIKFGFCARIQERMKVTCDILRKINKPKLYEICHQILENNAGTLMIKLLNTVESESAILHGDCWSNNFMYKYKSEDDTFPTKVAILDWQISRLHSPVLDISYFIYCTCSEDQLNHFDELLDTYYSSFSTFLTQFGCNPEVIFPYSTLKTHWKKYSLYGFLMASSFLHIMLCENKEAPKDYKDGEALAEKIRNVTLKDGSEFEKRLIAVATHYCESIS